jgi:hypothetical protein
MPMFPSSSPLVTAVGSTMAIASGNGGNYEISEIPCQVNLGASLTSGGGDFLLIYICNFHVLSHLLLIYMCKLHWNQDSLSFSKCLCIRPHPSRGIWFLLPHTALLTLWLQTEGWSIPYDSHM